MFEAFTFEKLMDDALSEVPDTMDKREGSVIYDALAPAALMFANYYINLDMVLNEVSADTASYYFLIKRAAELGIYPREETNAILKMVVTPADAAVSAGDRFNLEDLNYSVTEKISGEDGAYKVQCETAGTVANQQLGDMLPIEYVDGLESATLTEVLIPGEDEEDVEDFRARYFASFTDKSFGGNKTDYKDKVNAIEGVGDCRIVREWKNGYNPLRFIPTDAVKTWFSSLSAQTVGEEVYKWLSDVYNAAKDKLLTVGGTVKVIIINSEYKPPTQTLVDTVQETIDPPRTTGEGDGLAPIGHVVNVVGVKEREIDYTMSITYSGATFDDLKDQIASAILSYHDALIKDWASSGAITIRANVLEASLLNIKGIVNVSDTTINGSPVSITLPEDVIPARGGTINGYTYGA